MTLKLDDLLRSQSGVRHRKDELERLARWMKAHPGRFPSPVSINRFEDGMLYLRDGHGRITIARSLGMTQLVEARHFRLEHYTYAEYLQVDVREGWITPFDPRVHTRLAQLQGYKTLIQKMKEAKLPAQSLVRFVLAHPEAYRVNRTETRSEGELDAEQVGFEGSFRDREAYFAAMDQSMPVKVGQLVTVFPESGILLECGAGSGQQSAAYAAYYPGLCVVGSDLDLSAVRSAQRRFSLSNLVFLQADALDPVLGEGTVDAAVDSSLGHHLVSYGEPSFVEKRIDQYRKTIFKQLKVGGRYGTRDFVVPDWPGTVWFSIPAPLHKLFEAFAREFRSHDFPKATDVKKVGDAYQAPAELAANFLLRLGYTEAESWKAELKEQYTYYNLRENVQSLERAGFRLDYAVAVRNPWIVQNWWKKNAVRVESTEGNHLDFPPTNGLFYATKPGPKIARRVKVKDQGPLAQPRWLKHQAFEIDGRKWDLIRVPGETFHFFPYEKKGGQVFLYLLSQYLKPGLLLYDAHTQLFEGQHGGFTASGLRVVAEDRKSSWIDVLVRKAKISRLASLRKPCWEKSTSYLVSPGGSDERVTSLPLDVSSTSATLAASKELRRFELNQALSACHLGAISDPLVELAIYRLVASHGLFLARWFGASLPRPELSRVIPVASLRAETAVFQPTPRVGFMEVRGLSTLTEFGDGRTKLSQLEFSLPRGRSVDTLSVIPYGVSRGKVYVGLERRVLPAFALRGLPASQTVVPAWRAHPDWTSFGAAERGLTELLAQEFDGLHGTLYPLGEGYFPSIDNSPERVWPYTLALGEGPLSPALIYRPLEEVLQQIDTVPDLHTRLSLYRLAHALQR